METIKWLRRDVEHCVYRCWNAHGVLLYIGATNSWTQRKCHHRRETPWWPDVATITTKPYPNRALALAAEKAAIRTENPRHNVERYEARPSVTSKLVGYGALPVRTRWS